MNLQLQYRVLGSYTGLVRFPSTTQVLEKYYLDPKVLTAFQISALKVRVFGKSKKPHAKPHAKTTKDPR